MVAIYDIDQHQYDCLSAMCLSEKKEPLIVPEPNPTGTLDERKLVEEYTKKATDLVQLGFLTETTGAEVNKSGIESFVSRYGYGYRVFHITDNGKAMFERKNLVVN